MALVAVSLIVAIVALALSGINENNAGTWTRRFLTSPGAGGVAAVIAAVLGALTFTAQLRHTRAADKSKDWWTTFEWVTDRALPSDTTADRISDPMAQTVLAKLVLAATNPVQETTCKGFIEELFTRRQKADQAPRTGAGIADSIGAANTPVLSSASEISSLRLFVTAARNTPAYSAQAEAFLYELEVREALLRLFTDGRLDDLRVEHRLVDSKLARSFVADAVVTFAGQTVAIEAKYRASDGAKNHAPIRFRTLSDPKIGWLIVSSADARFARSDNFDSEIIYRTLVWVPGDPEEVLLQEIRGITEQMETRLL